MPVLTITNNVQGVLNLGSVIGSVDAHSTKQLELTVAEIEASKDKLVSLQATGTISWEVSKTLSLDDDAAEFMPAANSTLRTSGPRRIYVDDTIGNDENSGERLSPLKTIQAAEALIPDVIRHEVLILVQPHGGSGYAWPTFRARVFSGSGVGIYVYFPEINVVSSGDTAQSGSTDELLRTTGSLSVGALDGLTIEILSGAAQGDRRTVRNNDAADIYPCAEFTAPIVAGDSFRIIEPDPGNLVIPTELIPMVQGTGLPNQAGPLGHVLAATPGDYIPGVNLVNAIVSASTDVTFIADGRLILLGCRFFNDTDTFVRYHGQGQLLLGRHSWNAVLPPSTETTLTKSSWVGWGAHFAGGHWTLWAGVTPYVSGYLVTEERYVVQGGIHYINGHIKGTLRVFGENNGTEQALLYVSFGKAAPFPSGPQANPGWVSCDMDLPFAAVTATGFASIILHDETQLTNLGTGPVIGADNRGVIRTLLQIIIAGTNGGDGVVVEEGAKMTVTSRSSHVSIDLQGTVAGQLFSIGPRNLNAVMVDDLNNRGDFVSGARAFWDTGLVVTTHVVTLTTIGAVVAVEATTATSAGPKLIQRSAAPAAGAVQVTYDAVGIATLTFNATDAVTVADVYLQPEDDGTLIRAI